LNNVAHPISTVGALIFNPAREVLMIRTHKWSNLWGIPGGKIKWGETAPAALIREVREETALEISNIQFAMAQDCIDSKEFYKPAHFVLLNYTCDTPGGQVVLNDEAEEFQWMRPQAALGIELNTPTRILIEEVRGRIWT
jgi:ADP-ribose pyrophosphatase YjhB (NUDIX family)